MPVKPGRAGNVRVATRMSRQVASMLFQGLGNPEFTGAGCRRRVQGPPTLSSALKRSRLVPQPLLQLVEPVEHQHQPPGDGLVDGAEHHEALVVHVHVVQGVEILLVQEDLVRDLE